MEKISELSYEQNKELFLKLERYLEMLPPKEFKFELEDALVHGYPINFKPEKTSPGTNCLSLLLSVGVSNCALEHVRILLDAGADTEQKDNYGRNALIIASTNYAPYEIIEELLKHTTDIDTKDKWNGTAFNEICLQYIKGSQNPKFIDQPLLRLIRLFVARGANTDGEWDHDWENKGYDKSRKFLKKYIAMCLEQISIADTQEEPSYAYEL